MREMSALELHHFRFNVFRNILHSKEVPVDSKNKRVSNTINSSMNINIFEVNLIISKHYIVLQSGAAEPEYVGWGLETENHTKYL